MAASTDTSAAMALPPKPSTVAMTKRAQKEAMLVTRARLAFLPVCLRKPARNRREDHEGGQKQNEKFHTIDLHKITSELHRWLLLRELHLQGYAVRVGPD